MRRTSTSSPQAYGRSTALTRLMQRLNGKMPRATGFSSLEGEVLSGNATINNQGRLLYVYLLYVVTIKWWLISSTHLSGK